MVAGINAAANHVGGYDVVGAMLRSSLAKQNHHAEQSIISFSEIRRGGKIDDFSS